MPADTAALVPRAPVNARRWCFTWNNYPADHESIINGWPRVQYAVVGRETAPTTGTPHLQGYVVFTTSQRLSAVRQLSPTAHWSMAVGTSAQNREYCTKSGDFFEIGECPDQVAARARAAGSAATAEKYKRAWDQAKLGSIEEIDPSLRIRHYGTLRMIQKDYMVKPPDAPDVTGVWIWGPPGTGKSFTARRDYPGAYMKMQNKWWDGYQDEPNVLLDDYDCKELGHHLKIWCDRYSFLAESKGSARHIRPARIIITSNYSIEFIFGNDPVLVAALRRRFDVHYLDRVYDPRVVPATVQSVQLPESQLPLPLPDDVVLLPVAATVVDEPIHSSLPDPVGDVDGLLYVPPNAPLHVLQDPPSEDDGEPLGVDRSFEAFLARSNAAAATSVTITPRVIQARLPF